VRRWSAIFNRGCVPLGSFSKKPRDRDDFPILVIETNPGFAIVNEKKRPHPWDTHRQFSIKTLLSKQHTSSHQVLKK